MIGDVFGCWVVTGIAARGPRAIHRVDVRCVFWVEAITVADDGKPIVWIVDLTATQFADGAIRPRRVVIARYWTGYGRRYRFSIANERDARRLVHPRDYDDVAEFERRCRRVRWIREAA